MGPKTCQGNMAAFGGTLKKGEAMCSMLSASGRFVDNWICRGPSTGLLRQNCWVTRQLQNCQLHGVQPAELYRLYLRHLGLKNSRDFET